MFSRHAIHNVMSLGVSVLVTFYLKLKVPNLPS